LQSSSTLKRRRKRRSSLIWQTYGRRIFKAFVELQLLPHEACFFATVSAQHEDWLPCQRVAYRIATVHVSVKSTNLCCFWTSTLPLCLYCETTFGLRRDDLSRTDKRLGLDTGPSFITPRKFTFSFPGNYVRGTVNRG
jgi:hypothetical protein